MTLGTLLHQEMKMCYLTRVSNAPVISAALRFVEILKYDISDVCLNFKLVVSENNVRLHYNKYYVYSWSEDSSHSTR